RTRARGLVAAAAAATAVLLATPIARIHVHGRGALEPAERIEVRAVTSGFADRILALDGDRVEAGQPLVEMADVDLPARIEALRLESEILRAEWAGREAGGDPAGAVQKRIARESRLADLGLLRSKEKGLVLRAPVAGVLLGLRLADRRGRYLREG